MDKQVGGKRNECIDWCRFIGIILVVIGHSGCPDILESSIYLFHMALFFFLSGFCYKDKNDQRFSGFFLRNLKVYFYFVCFNGAFIILHNTFLRINIYSADTDFLLLDCGNRYGLSHCYSSSETLTRLVKNFLFADSEQMGGATWFLRVLFFVRLFHALSGFLLTKAKKEKYRETFCYACGAAFLIAGWLFYRADIHFPLELQAVFSAYFPFALGVFWEKHISGRISELTSGRLTALYLLSGVFLILLSSFHSINLGLNQIVNPVYYGAATIIGVIHVYVLSLLCTRHIKSWKIIICISKTAGYSMWIVCLHFLAFKIVTAIYTSANDLPPYYISCFPTFTNSGSWWIIYTITGVCVPVLTGIMLTYIFDRFIRGRFKKRSPKTAA